MSLLILLRRIPVFFPVYFCIGLILSVCASVAFAEDAGTALKPVEVATGGQVFPSLQDYRNAQRELKVQAEEKEKSTGVSEPDAVPSSSIRAQADESGWKTLWVGKPPSVETNKKKSLVPDQVALVATIAHMLSPEGMAKAEVKSFRILGVSPSMNELVKMFMNGEATARPLTPSIAVTDPEDLGMKLQQETAGREGPFLVLSDFGRVRLMGLQGNDGSQKSQVKSQKQDFQPPLP